MVRRFASLIFMCALAGCSNLGEFGKPGPVQSEFSRTLDVEYTGLADYEAGVLNNSKIADYFRGKAAKAHQGGMPLPDDPSGVAVPDGVKADINGSYNDLIHALQNGAWIDSGPLAAMAQTRYDCWLSIQMLSGQPGAGQGCRDKFDEAMALLKPAAEQNSTAYTIYFNSEAIAVGDDGMEDVRQAAAALRARPGWVVVLAGYTDPGEKGKLDRNLSIRRAMSVRNALAQQGVAIGDVFVGTYGIAPEGKGGQPDHERRVEMNLMPKAQAAAMNLSKVQDVLPENFGSVEPVF